MNNNSTHKKAQFTSDYDLATITGISYIVIVIELPSKELELIINSKDLEEKFMYYLQTYDSDLVMYDNKNIRVVDWLIV